jgi:hypothetical protein
MSYFKNYPRIEINGVNMPDITATVSLDGYGRDAFFEYEIKEGETPEMISHRMYNDTNLACFILLLNNIIDVYREWPLDNEQLLSLVKKLYGANAVYGIHHYENSVGQVVPDNYPEYDRFPITNISYETSLNDKKRKIRLPLPEVMVDFEREFKKLLKS